MSAPVWVLFIVSWAGLAGVVWKLFSWCEEVATERTLKSVTRWLRGGADQSEQIDRWLRDEKRLLWPDTFLDIFDRLFTDTLLSRAGFLRSALASYTSIVLICLLHMVFIRRSLYVPELGQIVFAIVAVAVLNLLPDYFSLIETRYVLGKLQGSRSRLRAYGWLAIDFIATWAIVITAFLIFITLTLGVGLVADLLDDLSLSESLSRIENILPEIPEFFLAQVLLSDFRFFSDVPPFIGACIYSTFFTSVWVWAYASAGTLIRLWTALGLRLGKVQALLDIDKHPLKCIGFVICMMITLCYSALLFVNLLV